MLDQWQMGLWLLLGEMRELTSVNSVGDEADWCSINFRISEVFHPDVRGRQNPVQFPPLC